MKTRKKTNIGVMFSGGREGGTGKGTRGGQFTTVLARGMNEETL